MKKKYLIFIGIFIVITTILGIIYYNEILGYFNITNEPDKLKITLIIINLFVYLVRTILIKFINFTLKAKMTRYFLFFTINIIWIGFIFWLIFVISPQLGIAITSFMIIAFSLTFRDRISNIASSIMILSSKSVDIGDLIETNDFQGIVSEINLNYTKLTNFSGIDTYLPNKNVYNASIKKFTQNISRLSKDNDFDVKDYAKIFQDIITFNEEKFTRYIKNIEIPFEFKVMDINNQLSKVFDKYEKLLSIRPYAYINCVKGKSTHITIQILSKDPNMIIIHKNQFMKDILYNLASEKILTDSKSTTKRKK